MPVGEQRHLADLVILTRNQFAYVENALNGARSQRYSPFEVITLNDLSIHKSSR